MGCAKNFKEMEVDFSSSHLKNTVVKIGQITANHPNFSTARQQRTGQLHEVNVMYVFVTLYTYIATHTSVIH